jgi:hypothetical protein
MKKLLLLSALLIFACSFGQLDTKKNKQTIKEEFIGKAARMGPFLKKNPDSQTYFLSHNYFKIVNKETKKMEKRKHRVVFKSTEKELEILYNKFYVACGSLETTFIKIGETLFEIKKAKYSASVKVTKNNISKGVFLMHQNQVDMLFGKRPFSPNFLFD